MKDSNRIAVVTKMRRIPPCCRNCAYYNSMGTARGMRNYGACVAMGRAVSTEKIQVSKERLPGCPLRMIED